MDIADQTAAKGREHAYKDLLNRAITLLKEVEWCSYDEMLDENCCPCCGSAEVNGAHEEGCRLDAYLKLTKPYE